jgi:hypothetical protein
MSSVPDSPPNADESYWTIADEEWFLERYMADAWTVTEASFPETNHGGQVCLAAALAHDNGHELSSTPIDPHERTGTREVLRTHRILLEDAVSGDSTYYAFVEPESRPPHVDGVRRIDADVVKKSDDLAGGKFWAKGTTANSLAKAKACLIAAARDITAKEKQRQEWFGIEEERHRTRT